MHPRHITAAVNATVDNPSNEQPVALLTVRDVCKRLQLSRPKVYELLRAGEIRSITLSKSETRTMRRIPPAALEEFIAARLNDGPDAA